MKNLAAVIVIEDPVVAAEALRLLAALNLSQMDPAPVMRAMRVVHTAPATPDVWIAMGGYHQSPTGPAEGPGGALTEREMQMMDLISRGWRNRQICAALHLSPNSVKSYIRSAYRKAGVTSRTQAVVWWMDNRPERTDPVPVGDEAAPQA